MRSIFFVFLISCFLYPKTSRGQITFYRDYMLQSTMFAGDIGHVVHSYEGGYAVLMKGFYVGLQQYDAAFFKTDSAGITQWSWFLNDTIQGNTYYSTSVIQARDSSYFFGFNVYDITNNFRPVIIKIDKNGIFLWKKLYADTSFAPGRLCSDAGNGFVFAGQIGQVGVGMAHCDGNGNIVWQKGYDAGQFALRLGLHTYRLSGNKLAFQSLGWNNNGPQSNYFSLMITDSLGIPIQCHAYRTPANNVWHEDLKQTSSKDIILAGKLQNICPNTQPASGLIRTDSLGNLRWHRLYDCNTDIINLILDTPDRWSVFGSYNGSFLLASADTNGNILSSRTTGTWTSNYTSGVLNEVIKVPGGYTAVGGNGPSFMTKLDTGKNGFCQSIPRTITSTIVNTIDSTINVTSYNTNLSVTPLSSAYIIPGWLYANTICENLITGSHPSTIEEELTRIYPNPVKDELIIEGLGNLPVHVSVYNAVGEVVERLEFTGEELKLNTNILIPGVYHILIDRGNQSIHRKFVKMD